MTKYIIAYDIAHPKRLRRVARILEKTGLRTQKSVFIFNGTEEELAEVINNISHEIDHENDSVQIWHVGNKERKNQAQIGRKPQETPIAVVLAPRQQILIQTDSHSRQQKDEVTNGK